MSELNPKLPQGLRETLERYYSAPAPRPEFAARLEAQLRQNVERTRPRQDVAERMSFMKLAQARPLLAILFVLLILLTLSGVVYAIGRAVGFIPGVGIVDQSMPLRVLTEPVVAERDGLTVTVSQVVADSDHTFVAYAIDGLFWGAEDQEMCGLPPSLQLSDGSTLSVVSGGQGPRGGRLVTPMNFETTVNYPPIPVGMSDVTFTFPCILTQDTGPENWQIPLKLSPAPQGYATPGVEVGVTFVASGPKFILTPSPTFDDVFTPEPYNPSLPATSTPLPNGSGLYLERVIELPNSYILLGNFADAGDLPGGLEINDDPYDNLPRIEDALGNPVPFTVRADMQPGVGAAEPWARYWAFEIPKPVQGPLTMTLDRINIGVLHTTQFDFDAGPNPQVGQKWELNLSLYADQYEYVIDSVEVIEGGYLFKYHSSAAVPGGASLYIEPQENDSSISGEENWGETVVTYTQKITYPGHPPTGQLPVELSVPESVPLQGPWTLTWTPPGK